VYVVSRKLLHCWQTDHMLRTNLIIFIVLRMVVEGREVGVVKPGTARKAALKAVSVYIYQVIK
jgi:hypothetical protein